MRGTPLLSLHAVVRNGESINASVRARRTWLTRDKPGLRRPTEAQLQQQNEQDFQRELLELQQKQQYLQQRKSLDNAPFVHRTQPPLDIPNPPPRATGPTTQLTNVEPLSEYTFGGYYPVTLGETVGRRHPVDDPWRYRILHKLAWDKMSTTWLAKDRAKPRFVAVKIFKADFAVTELEENTVGRVLREMEARHFVHRLDGFPLQSRFGSHVCIVYETVGRTVSQLMDSHPGRRMPANQAKFIARQMLYGLAQMHSKGIIHGNITPDNVALELPRIGFMKPSQLLHFLDDPKGEQHTLPDGTELSLVEPVEIGPWFPVRSRRRIKICNFDHSFHHHPSDITFDLPYDRQPPEMLFRSRLNHKMDLWHAGLFIFELFTGKPLIRGTVPKTVAMDMFAVACDMFPKPWEPAWDEIQRWGGVVPRRIVRDWELKDRLLEAYYSHDELDDELIEEDLDALHDLLAEMLRFEPCKRTKASSLHLNNWLASRVQHPRAYNSKRIPRRVRLGLAAKEDFFM